MDKAILEFHAFKESIPPTSVWLMIEYEARRHKSLVKIMDVRMAMYNGRYFDCRNGSLVRPERVEKWALWEPMTVERKAGD